MLLSINTAQKIKFNMKFSIKSFIENFNFWAVKKVKHELLNNLEGGLGILSMASSKYYDQRKPNSFLISKISANERT